MPSPKKMSRAAPGPSLGAAAMLGALSWSAGCVARARSAVSSGSSFSSASNWLGLDLGIGLGLG